MAKPLYDITQCALYKVQSKARLASLLNVSVSVMLTMAKSQKYRQFMLEEQVCPFTGKKTKERQVQTPTEALRLLHDRVRDLLQRVQPPSYAHAAVKGKSYRSNAEAHKNSSVVATFDIRSFYSSTSETAVFHFFLDQLHCAPDIAGILVRLLCFPRSDSFACLPTGSPISPLLSIYANKPMFDALERLAVKHGLIFTCYVDDLTFSGENIPRYLISMVASIMKRFGHEMAIKKTKIFSEESAKHVTGVVIYKGEISVPYMRFKKMRKIESAIFSEKDGLVKFKLMQRLSGLLGEAAYLDPRYKRLASESYRSLSDFRETTEPVG